MFRGQEGVKSEKNLPDYLYVCTPLNCHLAVGRASVSVKSGSAWVRIVICATVEKRVGCSLNYGGYGRVQV